MEFSCIPESQGSCNEADEFKESMSYKNETEKQSQKEPNHQTHSTATEEPTKPDKFEKTRRVDEEEEGKCGNSLHKDDSGYHTPTSPASKLRLVFKCPPAPERPKGVRYIRRRGRIGIMCRGISIPDEQIVSLLGYETEAGPMCKKARREDE